MSEIAFRPISSVSTDASNAAFRDRRARDGEQLTVSFGELVSETARERPAPRPSRADELPACHERPPHSELDTDEPIVCRHSDQIEELVDEPVTCVLHDDERETPHDETSDEPVICQMTAENDPTIRPPNVEGVEDGVPNGVDGATRRLSLPGEGASAADAGPVAAQAQNGVSVGVASGADLTNGALGVAASSAAVPVVAPVPNPGLVGAGADPDSPIQASSVTGVGERGALQPSVKPSSSGTTDPLPSAVLPPAGLAKDSPPTEDMKVDLLKKAAAEALADQVKPKVADQRANSPAISVQLDVAQLDTKAIATGDLAAQNNAKSDLHKLVLQAGGLPAPSADVATNLDTQTRAMIASLAANGAAEQPSAKAKSGTLGEMSASTVVSLLTGNEDASAGQGGTAPADAGLDAQRARAGSVPAVPGSQLGSFDNASRLAASADSPKSAESLKGVETSISIESPKILDAPKTLDAPKIPEAPRAAFSDWINQFAFSQGAQHRSGDLVGSLDRALAGLPTPHAGQDALRPTPMQVLPIEIGMNAMRGVKNFQIRLDPAELGRVDVQLDIRDDGEVKATLVVDRVETLTMLRRDAHSLQYAFEQAGLRQAPDGLTFSLRGDNQSSRDGQGQGENQKNSSWHEENEKRSGDVLPDAVMRRVMIPNSSLDLVI
ncbi:T3SS_Flik_C domain containing protein [Rhabdaerophilaceae bacterium]